MDRFRALDISDDWTDIWSFAAFSAFLKRIFPAVYTILPKISVSSVDFRRIVVQEPYATAGVEIYAYLNWSIGMYILRRLVHPGVKK